MGGDQHRWDTVEQVDVEITQSAGTVDQFRLHGELFNEADWPSLEQSPGILHASMRATAWVCEDGKTPALIDWTPPPDRLQE